MKCYLVDGKGYDNIVLGDRPIPKICEQDVKIKVKACSLNYRDLMVAKGIYPKGVVFPPFIALSDMAGVVEEVGSGVVDLKVGDRVINSSFRHWPAGKLKSSWARSFVGGMGVDGVLAEYVVYPADALVKIPEYLSFEEASTFTIAGLTAWSAVVTHGNIRPGEWILLQGTGGVSIFSAQIAKAMGAQVIMTTSSSEKEDYVKKNFGVDHTVNHRDPDWPKKVKAIVPEGVNVVVEVVGGDNVAKSVQLCTYEGRVSVVGVLAGTQASFDVRDLLSHQVQVRGIYMESAQELRAFVKAAAALKLKPAVDKVFPFEEAKEAYKHLDSQKHIGKVAIKFA